MYLLGQSLFNPAAQTIVEFDPWTATTGLYALPNRRNYLLSPVALILGSFGALGADFGPCLDELGPKSSNIGGPKIGLL